MKKIIVSLTCTLFLSSCESTLSVLQGIGEIGNTVTELAGNRTSSTLTQQTSSGSTQMKTKKKEKVERECYSCKGSGQCFACHGTGKSTQTRMGVPFNCSICHGKKKCTHCDGKGVRVTYKEVYE